MRSAETKARACTHTHTNKQTGSCPSGCVDTQGYCERGTIWAGCAVKLIRKAPVQTDRADRGSHTNEKGK